ncbi:MAG: TerB family tellurite resistance protein [Cyanomargarita calcarea GSE-NOS-MK-12-04C]|jgi:uncharacterized tellurite resistance protein B-like protein|uniref:TerB family tellurite resistance protein n=1 Tax=Cyanomargarita calcarea GSE-NOS-MK-12-04C TaxID=2839659 RepID=A0A951QUM5_9CYAN|nr:TerB family tellurite resistance protein [Cyanomargarita calcarea GSE-NOS-MK-12-04C]
MLKKLQPFFALIARNETKQSEREASIDLMIMTMYIDKSLKIAEDETINEYAKNLLWESPISLEKYLGVATAKVRNVLGDAEKTNAFLEDVKSRISTQEMKKEVFEACKNLAHADGELSKEEQEFLDIVATLLL